MTTLVPRPPYTQDELALLYPKSLKLQLVQVVCEVFPSQRLPIRVGPYLYHAGNLWLLTFRYHSSFGMVILSIMFQHGYVSE